MHKKKCPIDGSILIPDIIQNVLIDKCPQCKGIWLDKDEIIKIKVEMKNDTNLKFVIGLASGLSTHL